MGLRQALVSVVVAATVLFAADAGAQCAGDCSVEGLSQPKALEKFVKTAWKQVAKCAKKGKPACPQACSLSDGSAAPFSLSQGCADLVTCNLGLLAESAYGASWDDVSFCALGAADACGNARGKGAGKLAAARLKRRRTSKMSKFARDQSKCAAKVDKAGACGGQAICSSADDWVAAIVPVFLKSGGVQALDFDAAVAGEARATLRLSAEFADWSNFGAESVVLDFDVDGVPRGQIVVYNGAAPTDYRIMLGEVSAGAHRIGLHHNKKVSPAKKSGALLEAAATVEVFAPADPSYAPLHFAPVLRGLDGDLNPFVSHKGNAVSDVPLITYVKAISGVGLTTYRYVMIWSNEDGGTGAFPDILLTQFGRTTDIETYVEVDVLDDGSFAEARFRPDESGTPAVFAGEFFEATHPIVRTSSANGLIEDDGESRLNFFLAPFEFDDSGVPREQGMDLDPVSYVVMAKEMIRESKVEGEPNKPDNKKLSDLRNYLFVEYDISVSLGGNVLAAYAVVGGTTYRSDHFTASAGILPTLITDGNARTAIELPSGTTLADISEWGFKGVGLMSGTLFSMDGFMLDSAMFRASPGLSFSGPLVASGIGPTWAVPLP